MSQRSTVVAAILLLAAAVLGPAGAAAQSRSGRVTVHVLADSLPVANALVRADGMRARTNDQGDAALALPPGVATIGVTKIGFQPDSTFVDVRPGLDTSVVVRLAVQPEAVAPVFVTSTRAERRLEEEPMRIEVLGGDDVGEKSEMRPADARTLLSEMSGVRMQTLSPLGATNVRIQGLPGRYTALLQDGLPLYGGQASGFTLVEVVPLDLRQAEVIKGAASALYGPQALAGVVDLISRRPPDTSQALVNQSAPASTDAMGFLSRTLRRSVGVTVLGGLHRQSAEDNDNDGWAEVPGFRRAELRPRLFFNDSAGHSLMATVGGFAEDRASGTIGAVTPFAVSGLGPRSPFADSLTTRHIDAGLVGQWRSSPTLVFAARTSASDDARHHQFGLDVENDTRRTLYGEATATRSIATNVLVAGAAWQRDAYANAQVSRFDATYSTPGLFLQDTYTPMHWLSGTVNGRCDWSNVYGTICTPRVSLLARTGSAISSRLSVGNGWFAPQPSSDLTEAFGLSRVFEPAPLVAEHARTASLDVTMTQGPLQVNGTLFANRVANPVGLQLLAGDTSGAVNLVNAIGPLQTHGGELFAVFNQDPFIVTAYYGATRSREVSSESGLVREAPLVPREDAGLDFAVDDDESGAYAALEVFYTGRQALEDNPSLTVSRPYTTVGVLLADRWRAATVFLNLENLTGVRLTKYQSLLRPTVGPGGSWTVEPWAPLEGRRVNAGVRWAWP